MKKIALTLVVLALGISAFGQSTETKNTRNEIAPAASAQELGWFTVYASGGAVVVSNPTSCPLVANYAISIVLPGGIQSILYRSITLMPGQSFVDYANGYYAVSAWALN
jgi:hypothetical protein